MRGQSTVPEGASPARTVGGCAMDLPAAALAASHCLRNYTGRVVLLRRPPRRPLVSSLSSIGASCHGLGAFLIGV
jgi:hypothetical protein